MTKQRMPDGWDEHRIAALARHYDSQNAAAELAELKAGWERGYSTLQVPEELVPAVHALIAHYESLRSAVASA